MNKTNNEKRKINAISVAKSAIETVDKYIDGEISFDLINDEFDLYLKELDYVKDYVAKTDLEQEDLAKDFDIHSYILLLSSNVLIYGNHKGSDKYKDVIESRNELAEAIGMEKRK